MTRERDLLAQMQLADMLPLDGAGSRSALSAEVYVPTEVMIGESQREAVLRWRGAASHDDYVTGAPAFAPKPAEGMLTRFLRLGNETDVLNFATRFGVLAFCEDCGEPSSLGGPGLYAGSVGSSADGFADHTCSVFQDDGICAEPVSRWLDLAAQIRSIALVAARLHAGSAIASDDMRRALGLYWVVLEPHASRVLRKPQNYWAWIGVTLRELTRRAGIRLMVQPLNKSIGLGLEIPSTFSHLVLQLMLAVAQAGDLEVCSICQLPYLRIGRRRATPSRRNVCTSDDCMRDAARIRQQESRNRTESQSKSNQKVPQGRASRR